ncbi:MAG: hypothetical protein L0154_24290 [Chloroflexi bacterium]|nr:hypothetical protein [Chloroflexota bacterium]
MVTKRIDTEQTPTTLDEVLAMVGPNTEIVIMRGEDIVARILPSEQQTTTVKERVPGLHAGSIWTSDDFDEPLPDSFWLGDE